MRRCGAAACGTVALLYRSQKQVAAVRLVDCANLWPKQSHRASYIVDFLPELCGERKHANLAARRKRCFLFFPKAQFRKWAAGRTQNCGGAFLARARPSLPVGAATCAILLPFPLRASGLTLCRLCLVSCAEHAARCAGGRVDSGARPAGGAPASQGGHVRVLRPRSCLYLVS